MEIRKTSRRIFREKKDAIKTKIAEAGFYVVEREGGDICVQRKRGFFQEGYSFDYLEKEDALTLTIWGLGGKRRKFCGELGKKAGIKIVCYLK